MFNGKKRDYEQANMLLSRKAIDRIFFPSLEMLKEADVKKIARVYIYIYIYIYVGTRFLCGPTMLLGSHTKDPSQYDL